MKLIRVGVDLAKKAGIVKKMTLTPFNSIAAIPPCGSRNGRGQSCLRVGVLVAM